MGTITNYISAQYKNIVDSAHQVKGRLSELYEFSPPLSTLVGRIARSTIFFSLTGYYLINFAKFIELNDKYKYAELNQLVNYDRFKLPIICFIYSISLACAYYDLPSIPREWEIRKLAKDQSKKNVVLHCIPKNGDWNGATTRQTKKEIELLKELSKTHSIVHKIVSNPQDINAAIDEIKLRGQKVKILWITAHGSSDTIQLNLFQSIKGKNINEVQFTKLAPDADIVLQSCSTGEENPNSMNFAEWAQIYAGRKRKVHAPKDAALAGETIYTKTWWSRNKFYFFKEMPIPIINLLLPLSNVTANISYYSAFNKARRLGHNVKTDGWTTSLFVLISQIWGKIFQFRV